MKNAKRKKKLTKAELIRRLKEECGTHDTEANHSKADELLLEYINDKKVAAAFSDIDKWYA